MAQLLINLLSGEEYLFDCTLSGTSSFTGITNGINVGGGINIIKNIDNNTLYLYTLSASSGINITTENDKIILSATTQDGEYLLKNIFTGYSANTNIKISGITTASGKTVINNGLTIENGKFLLNDAVYDDLRVPVTSTEVAGSNPPVKGIFMTNNSTGGTGTALAFNGTTQNVQVSNDSSLDFSDDYSIEFWVRPKPSTTLWSSYLIQKSGSFYINYIGGSRVRWQVNGYANLDSSTALNVNGWNHIVCTLENTGDGNDVLTIYINGVLDNTVGPTFGTPGTSSNDLFIGSGDGSNYALCDIDEVRIWQKVLTPTEVQESYNNGSGTFGIDVTNLMAGYHFDEGSGSNITDYSTNNNSGTTNNNPSWITGHIGEETSMGVLTEYFTTASTQELYFSVQLPHSWKRGTTIEPHIHWSPDTDDPGTVVWGLEYTWANINDKFNDTQIVYVSQETSGNSIHHMTNPMNVTGITKSDGRISSMIICRVLREPSNTGDTYPGNVAFHEIDFHFLVEKFGTELAMPTY